MANRQKIYDVECLLADQTLIAASAAGLVSAAAAVFDTGGGYTEGKLVINVTAIEVNADEDYEFILQGSNTANMGGGLFGLARLRIGADSIVTCSADSVVGNYIIPWNNLQNGTVYRYIRMYLVVAGTVATGINYGAWLTK